VPPARIARREAGGAALEAGAVGVRRDPLSNPEPLIRRVYAYAAYRLGAGPDAEDVTSDVFERALRYADSYDAAKGPFVAWLLGIARRCVDERLSAPVALPLENEWTAAPGNLEEDTVLRMALRDALEELGDRDRELVSLHYAGLNGGQIAGLLEVRRNTIDVALHRALARLRVVLERQADDEEPRAQSL
jgi:RNA polymerase sigma-70 factor (ECF subfamily)